MTFRSMALVGTTAALAVLVAAATVLAQGLLDDPDRPSYQGEAPRPDFPGPRQRDPSQSDNPKMSQPDAAQSPRPDFPGAKEGGKPSQK
jgi:hypothetical protein